MPTSGVHSPTLSGISTLSQEGVKTRRGGLKFGPLQHFQSQPEGIIISLGSHYSGIRIWHSLYTLPEVHCAFLVCTSPTCFQVFLLLARMESQVFGISVQTNNGIRFWHSLYTLPEVTVPTSGVHLSNTFRYFYL